MAAHTDLLGVMQARLGIQEVPGEAGDNPVILGWFSAIGHPEIEHDEVSWCAVCVGSALVECGLPIPTRDTNMLARSYLTYGVACEPQPGAIAIWPRGRGWQGHVNVVESVTDDGKVICIGGNQTSQLGGDAVTRTKPLDPSTALGFRMPISATVKALRKAGSTEIQHGDKLQNAGLVATILAPVIAALKDLGSYVPHVPKFDSIPDGLSYWQTTIEGANAVFQLALDNPWLAGTILCGLICAAVGHSIKSARVAKAVAGVPLSSQVAAMGAA